MAAKIKGRGVMWSVGDVTFTGGIARTCMNQSIDFSQAWERRAIQDNGGTTRAVVFFNGLKQLRITTFPYDTSVTLGKTAVTDFTPQPGAIVTITDADGTVLDGTYHVVSASQRRTVTDAVQVDLELETSDEGADITTLIS